MRALRHIDEQVRSVLTSSHLCLTFSSTERMPPLIWHRSRHIPELSLYNRKMFCTRRSKENAAFSLLKRALWYVNSQQFAKALILCKKIERSTDLTTNRRGKEMLMNVFSNDQGHASRTDSIGRATAAAMNLAGSDPSAHFRIARGKPVTAFDILD